MFCSGRANNNEHMLNVVVKQLQSQHSLEADRTGSRVPGKPELFQNKQNLPLDKMAEAHQHFFPVLYVCVLYFLFLFKVIQKNRKHQHNINTQHLFRNKIILEK